MSSFNEYVYQIVNNIEDKNKKLGKKVFELSSVYTSSASMFFYQPHFCAHLSTSYMPVKWKLNETKGVT